MTTKKTTIQKTKDNSPILLESIENRILRIRGINLLIDTDLAELYGVTTKALNQAVKRNTARFPHDFVFQLNKKEKIEVVTNCDHLSRLKFSSTLPYAFTEHGAIMAANVLEEKRCRAKKIPSAGIGKNNGRKDISFTPDNRTGIQPRYFSRT